MVTLNAAELLARVRKRKQELAEQSTGRTAEQNAAEPTTKHQKQNPYLEAPGSATLAAAKPRLSIKPSPKSVRVTDESELLYVPLPIPASGKEWWDENQRDISNLVYRPGRIEPGGQNKPGSTSVHLTAEERKRKRKQERLLKRQDKQERVRLGIDPPPPPKLKLSNVASVFGPAFANDPTRYEELARQSELERREAHEKANNERQLTAEQRWSKHEAKIGSHRSQGLHVAVFRVEQLDEDTGKQRFLVDYTAKKFLFTGTMLMGSPALIVVEGGEPEVLKFTKLLTRKLEGCTVLWRGMVSHSQFKAWSLHKFPSKLMARDFLRNHNSLPYYLLMHDAPLSET